MNENKQSAASDPAGSETTDNSSDLLQINPNLAISKKEYQFDAVRSQGAGGQHVNKTSTAVVLSFDILASSLPDAIQQKLLNRADSRISNDGVLRMKIQTTRSQFRNKQLAEQMLCQLIDSATQIQKKRRATKPSRASVKKRLDSKNKRAETKKLRQKINS